ncbi:MAG: GNAT family N-acetyltransferase [Kiritimatiellaeota bacterium]|nr:GNAT family N-acetyltransferase [Kiritimatiellota bacterium]
MNNELLPRMVPLRHGRPVLVRTLEPSDGPALGEFLESLSRRTEHFFHPFPLTAESGARFAKRTDVQAAIALDPVENLIVGMAWTSSATPPGFGICVRDDRQGRGLGRRLAAITLAQARESGADAVQLTVLKDNPAAKLYRELGFIADGEASDPRGPSLHMTLHFDGNEFLPGIVETGDDIRRELAGAKLLIVPYCHADWAWTHTRQWHALRYVQVLEEVLDIFERQDRDGIPSDAPHAFRWYLDTVAMELEPFMEHSPQRLPELRRRIAEGRVAVCGGFANVRPNMVGDETFLRSLLIGGREFRRLFPEADLGVFADTVDVAVGHPQMPQILRLAGFRGYRFWRPQTALNLKGVPFEFVWEGLDGARITCSRGCYGGVISTRLVPSDFCEHWDETLRTWWELEIAARAILSPAALPVLNHGMDDARPLHTNFHEDAPLDLPAFIEEWNRREVTPMRFATPLDVFRELEERRDKLPVVSGVIDPCDVCYNMAWNGSGGIWRLRILGDRALTAAERWRTLARQVGCPYPGDELAELWRELLPVCAHAVQWLFEEDYREMRERALTVIRQADRLRTEGLQALAKTLPNTTLANSLPPPAAVFNPSPWVRSAQVRLHLAFPAGAPEECRLTDTAGNNLPWQIVTQYDHAGKTWEWDVEAVVSLPPHGMTAVCIRPGGDSIQAPRKERPVRGGNATLEGKLCAEFRKKRLTAVHDRAASLRVETEGPEEIGTLRLYEVDPNAPLHVGEILSVHEVRWTRPRRVRFGPVRHMLRRSGRVGPHRVEMDVSTFPDDARIEWRIAVDWKDWNGFLALELPVPFPVELHGDIPFGVQEIDLEHEPYGPLPVRGWENIERRRPGLFFARSFVSAVGREKGLTLISHDGDRYYLWDSRRSVLSHVLINSFKKPQAGWEQYINEGIGGRGHHEFHCSLLLHAGDWRDAGIVRRAAELRNPPDVLDAIACARVPNTHAEFPQFSVEPAEVLPAALYSDSGATFLRISEMHGAGVAARVRLPGIRRAEVVDLSGRLLPDRKVRVIDGMIEVELRPWEICTLRLDLAKLD